MRLACLRSGENRYPIPKCVWMNVHSGATGLSFERTLQHEDVHRTVRSLRAISPPQTMA